MNKLANLIVPIQKNQNFEKKFTVYKVGYISLKLDN